MRLSETELREVYQQGTARSSRTDCLTADEIARISTGEIDDEERQQMRRHLMICSECAEEYRLIGPLKALADSAEGGIVAISSQSKARAGRKRSIVASPLAPRLAYIAATFLLAVSLALAIWSLSMRSQNQKLAARLNEEIAKGEQKIPTTEQQNQTDRSPNETSQQAVAPETSERLKRYETEIAELRRNVDELSRPQLNTPIIDLEPQGATRGESSARFKLIEVPSTAHLFTVVLNVSGQPKASSYAVEITDLNGQVIWKGQGLHKSADNTFTLSVSRRMLPAGRYHFVLYTLGAQRERVEDYAVEVQYK
jgi:hypothetical protein